MAAEFTEYEKNLDFNYITKYLHSARYISVINITRRLHNQLERPVRIIDIGCNSGRTYGILRSIAPIQYTGVDISQEEIDVANKRYASEATFLCRDATDPANFTTEGADLVLALDTLEHIREGAVVRIVENVCKIIRPKIFLVTVPVEIGPAIWIKTVGSKIMGYRRTPYTWSQAFWAGLYNLNRVPLHQTRHIGFNWYWLEQTIRHNALHLETRSVPFRWLPRTIAPTLMFLARCS